MKIIITGATGYIGCRVVELAINRGYQVISMSRQSVRRADLSWIHYDLTDKAVSDLPTDTWAVIHLAADTAATHNGDSLNELCAAQLLISAAKKANARFLFVSSQTARPNAPTVYGQTKWRIEQEVLANGGWVVRPGQVYGGHARGLFGTLVAAVNRLPILPAFLPAPKVQPIHVDDLAEGLLRIVEQGISAGILRLASPEPVSFNSFLSAIANYRVRRPRLFVPLPVAFIKLIGTMLGKRLRARTGIERLISLVELPLMDTTNDLKRLNLPLRALSMGMHISGDIRRHRLIYEGKALLTYVLKERPEASLLRRYARAIEKLRGGCPLDLPVWALRQPFTLALFDDRAFALSERGAEFSWRLDAATTLAEATTQGAYRFLGLGRRFGLLKSLILIPRALFAEVIWRVLRAACGPLLQRSMQNAGSQR